MNIASGIIILIFTVSMLGLVTDALNFPLVTATSIKIKPVKNAKKYTVVAKEWDEAKRKVNPGFAFKKRFDHRGIYTITGLAPGKDYQITVLAHQAKGRKIIERDVKKTKSRCKCGAKDCPDLCQSQKPRGCPLEDLPGKGNMTLRCTKGNKISSVCTWGCPKGYKILDKRSKRTKCRKNRTWTSSRLPECVPRASRCAAPPVSPQNGFAECVGDTCSYKCKDHFKLEGFASTLCKKDALTGKFKWNHQNRTFCTPTCKDLNLINGNVDCGKGGSNCSFFCDAGFALSHQRKLLCMDGEWSEAAPTCQPACPVMEKVNNGEVSCNGSGIGSTCSLQCNKSFIARFSRATCKVGRDGKASWSTSKYFCCAKCVFNDYVRLAIAVDNSNLENETEWSEVSSFILDTISQLHKFGFTVNVGVVVYGAEQRLLVPLQKIKTEDDIQTISTKLLSYKHSYDEGVSNQGAAMEFAYTKMLSDVDHHEEEPFLLFTAGKTSDDEVLDQVRAISSKDINILAIGLSERVSDSYLAQIATNNYTARIENEQERTKVVYKINEMCRLYGCALASRTNKCT